MKNGCDTENWALVEVMPEASADDDKGKLITEEHEETCTREVPIMGMVYRDMTAEEIAEMEKIQTEMPESQPTAEERLNKVEQRTDTLEGATDDLVLMMADLIGGEN